MASLGRSALLAAASTTFCIDPLADISWAIPQLDAPRFPARQELHGIAIHQRYVLQIELNGLTDRLQIKKPLQLGNVLDLDVTTQRKDHFLVRRTLNFQHGLLVTYL